MVERVVATPEALALIAQLQAQYGELMFHQSGGCCDGSAGISRSRSATHSARRRGSHSD